ncbi:MAG: PEGA domain-containing protein [Candidatus Levyibacteriota bacterium]
MRKKLVGLLAIFIIFLGFFLLFQVIGRLLPKGSGALQVTSNVQAKVLLNGKDIGTTPLCKCDQNDRIEEGLYTLQLIPSDSSQSFMTKVQINKGVLTAVDRNFLPGSYASSYVLLLEKNYSNNADLAVYSAPSEALVTVDGNDSGVTPLLVKNVSASEHEIELQKGGFGKKTIRLRTVPGYKLVVQAVLGTAPDSSETLPGSEVTPTPTPTPTVMQNTVTILSTPTGFLRVRTDANINSAEIGRVKPGDVLPLVLEKTGWYQIQLDGKTGWISSDFAKKTTPTPNQ